MAIPLVDRLQWQAYLYLNERPLLAPFAKGALGAGVPSGVLFGLATGDPVRGAIASVFAGGIGGVVNVGQLIYRQLARYYGTPTE